MTSDEGLDPHILRAWLSARSIARGLPLPVPEYGGFRVDTGSDVEVARWVFPVVGNGLTALARSIRDPRYFLKLCGTADEFQAALPQGWRCHPPGYFMQATGNAPERPLAAGYRIEMKRAGSVLDARIFSATGALAASGYAAEAGGVCVYDRIVTEPEHRRKGLGQALMRALHEARQNPGDMELLVATVEGRALYSTLGWVTISPFSTASIVAP